MKWYYLVSLVGHFCLLEPGVWYRQKNALQYTDIDYAVFVGGQRNAMREHRGIIHGSAVTKPFDSFLTSPSPYTRVTYRYSPIMALLTAPNRVFGDSAAKYLFCALNFVTFFFTDRLLTMFQIPAKSKTALMVLATCNPVVWQVAARGNSDAVMTALVTACLYFYLKKRYVIAAVLHGISVHVKMYPILFLVTFMLAMNRECDIRYVVKHRVWPRYVKLWKALQEPNQSFVTRFPTSAQLSASIVFCPVLLAVEYLKLVDKAQLVFVGVSLSVALGLTAGVYVVYGWTALYEGFLYHFVRHDHRHNMAAVSTWASLVTPRRYYGFEVPAVIGKPMMKALLTVGNKFLVVVAGVLLAHISVSAALFVQTVLFVAFNGVITVQYFVWYLSLLPVALAACPNYRPLLMRGEWKPVLRPVAGWLAVWLASILSWTGLSHLFETRGWKPAFYLLTGPCLTLLAAHVALARLVVTGASPTAVHKT